MERKLRKNALQVTAKWRRKSTSFCAPLQPTFGSTNTGNRKNGWIGLAMQVCRAGMMEGPLGQDTAERPRFEFPGAYRRKPN